MKEKRLGVFAPDLFLRIYKDETGYFTTTVLSLMT